MNRRPLSFSNLVSVLALFVALGGAAHAIQKSSVGSREIEDSSVKSKDIKDSSLKSKDIKDGTIKGSDVGADSLSGEEIADGSIGGSDLANGTISGDDVADDTIRGADVDESTLVGVAPAGPAGGALNGSFPDPGIAPGAIGTQQFGPLPHAKLVGGSQLYADGIVTKAALGSPASSSEFDFDNADDSLTVLVPGLYAVSAYLIWSPNATGRRVVQIHVNGSNRIEDGRDGVGSGRTGQSVSTLLELDAGDVITLHGQQTSGGDLSTAPIGAPDNELNIYWVGP